MSRSPVTKKSKKPFLKFDANAFERDLIDDEAGLSRALQYLRTTVSSGGASDVLSSLLDAESRTRLLEYALAFADEGAAFLLREELLNGFDLSTPDSSRTSFLALARLDGFITILRSSADFPAHLAEDSFQFIQSSQIAISVLGDAGLLRQDGTAQRDEETSPKITKRKLSVSQKQAKQQAKRSRRDTMSIDEKPFRALNEPIPSSIEEAQELVLRLFEKQKVLLNTFIDLLRDPVLFEVIQEQCIPSANTTLPTNTVQPDKSEDGPIQEGDPLPCKQSAYPRVQPVKASLFFESAEGLGEWRIVLSTTAIKDMRKHRRDGKVFKVILKKIKELSTGFFSDDNQKRLKGQDKGVPIFEAKLTADLRLVYQIDLTTDFERNTVSQGIRVYGIFTHAQMDHRMWSSLSAQLATKGPEYRKRIEFRKKPETLGDNVYLPQSWPDVSPDESVEDARTSFIIDANDRESIHQWLVLEKYSVFSKELLNCVLHDKDASAVFTVSSQEREVIEHPSSSYVIGRSGTGKTTVMTFKLFGIERAAQIRSDEHDAKPHQLFVTQSPVLANKVKEFYAKFADFLSAFSGKSSPLTNNQSQSEPEGLVAADDDDDWQDNLPKRFSELQDQHFPLFLTYGKLCKLVEADLGSSFDRPTVTREDGRLARRDRFQNTDADRNVVDEEESQGSFVNFERFCNDYWPHFPQDLSKHLDPALVFSEFIGTIKGSQESLTTPNGYLSSETYRGLSGRTQSTFATERDRIYRLFEKYLALKREYRDYDLADRTHAIIRKIKEGHDFAVDYLYVDEAQDNLIIDAFFLRRLCRNPLGLFWAGDTAQTILIGSSFRFDDLKAALYAYERQLYPLASEKLIVQPAVFQLTTNYRSHGGIVNCAGLIIELITRFWPHSIDTLRREKGIVDGSKPVFFTGWSDQTELYKQFLSGEDGGSIEFGARQCILVRNDRAKDKLRVQVGEIGNVLTLYESKGLEFDDVLLYNFFEDSQCAASQWRVILNFLSTPEGTRRAVPRFDDVRHAGILTELKFLYVAITRARKNLWIIDRSEKGEPMKALFLETEKVELWALDRAPKLAEASTEEEWAEQGKEFFKKMQYREAIRCFRRARSFLECDIAEAYDFRHQARNMPRSKTQEARIEAFKQAARAFSSCAEKSSSQRTQKTYLHIAAECFIDARDLGQAAFYYEKAGEYTKAAEYFAEAVKFDDAIRVIKTTNLVDPGVAERVIGSSRLHYVHVEEIDKVIESFDAPEDALEYLEDFGLDVTRAMVLEKFGRIREAADLLHKEGQWGEAVALLKKDADCRESLQRAVDILLGELWKRCTFGRGFRQHDDGCINPLDLVEDFDKAKLPEEILNEVDMFDAIIRVNRDYLLDTYGKFLSQNNPQATVLILDRLLTSDYRSRISSMQDVVRYLEAWVTYGKILHNVWGRDINTNNPRTQKLFGFQEDSEDRFLLVHGSFLADYATRNRHASTQTTEIGVAVSHAELASIIKASITERLSSMVEEQVRTFVGIRNVLFGDPCLTNVTQGQCHRADCPHQHIDVKSADTVWFNARVRVHLLQIQFLQAVDFILKDSDRTKYQQDWIAYFFNILHPPVLELGGLANISRDSIPEFKAGMEAIAIWLQNRTYQIKPNHVSTRWFRNAIMEVAAISFWQDRDKARRSLTRAPFFTGEKILPALSPVLEQSQIPGLLGALDVSYANLIESGCKFIENVMRFGLKIDVGHVCRLVELLSATSVLLFKNNLQGNFHNCLLPRSWLVHLMPRLNFSMEYNIRSPIWWLVRQSADLALYLSTRSENEISHLRGASTFLIRSLSIQRICRAVCLIGLNTTREIRDHIINFVVRLRAACTDPVPRLLRPYLFITGWSDIRRATACSVPSSHLDWMVQLVQTGRIPMTFPSEAKIRRLDFKGNDDLMSRFAPARPQPGSTAISVPDLGPSVDPSVGSISGRPVQGEEEDPSMYDADAEPAQDIHEEDDHDNLLAPPEEAGASAEVAAQVFPVNFTIQEKAAGRIILRFFKRLRQTKERAAFKVQRWYRGIRARLNELEHTGLRGRRARYYKDCLTVDSQRNRRWRSCHHRIVFLGFTPDLLTCLDAIWDQVQTNKSQYKKKLSSKSNEAGLDYGKLHEQMTRTSEQRKRLDQLKSKIKPGSEWHENRTLDDLKSVVQDIASFLDLLEVGRTERKIIREVEEYILEKPARQGKGTKPALNVEDEY